MANDTERKSSKRMKKKTKENEKERFWTKNSASATRELWTKILSLQISLTLEDARTYPIPWKDRANQAPSFGKKSNFRSPRFHGKRHLAHYFWIALSRTNKEAGACAPNDDYRVIWATGQVRKRMLQTQWCKVLVTSGAESWSLKYRLICTVQ